MAKTPVADLVAVIKTGNEEDQPMFIPIGVLWKSQKGNLSGSIDAEPVQWKQGETRKIVIRARPGVTIHVEERPYEEGEKDERMAQGKAEEERRQGQRKTFRSPDRSLSDRRSTRGPSNGS